MSQDAWLQLFVSQLDDFLELSQQVDQHASLFTIDARHIDVITVDLVHRETTILFQTENGMLQQLEVH